MNYKMTTNEYEKGKRIKTSTEIVDDLFIKRLKESVQFFRTWSKEETLVANRLTSVSPDGSLKIVRAWTPTWRAL